MMAMQTPANKVQTAVEKAAATYDEWFASGDPSWLESKTRGALIDPILRALGWDTANREVCYPEWRFKNNLRVDYALFPRSTAQDFAAGMAVPAIIIEAKPVYRIDTGQRREHGQAIWKEDIDQLQKYVDAEPKPKPRWDVHLAGAGNRGGSLAGVFRPLIAGPSGSAVSPRLSGWTARPGICRPAPAPPPCCPSTDCQ